MRYGIFGDIHSNLEAFDRIIAEYKKEHIDKYICVGDIVGYGASPHECLRRFMDLNAISVCGNHDWASIGLFPVEYFNNIAKEAVEWTQEILNKEERGFLKSLKLIIKGQGFVVAHGSLCRPELFDYISDIKSAVKSFQIMEEDICFIGHSHIPAVFFMHEGKVKRATEDSIKVEPGLKYIINVGSVGQPRDGNPQAGFCIYDSNKKTVEIKRVDYDIEVAKNKILKAGLPEKLGYRLLTGL